MNGKENSSGETTKPINALLDEDYVGKEVVFIAFDKEKSSVTLDDNFVLIQAMEKRERVVKIVAAILACVFLAGIVAASVRLLQAGPPAEEEPAVIVTESPCVSDTQIPTRKPTKEPAVLQTKKPTKKPKRTKRPKKATEEPIVVTEAPQITEAPVITKAPVVTKEPQPTKDPFEEENASDDDPFEVE